MVDLIVLLIIIFFVLVGWCKGFGQYFLDLLIIILSLGVAWSYYQQEHEILKSFFICSLLILVLSLSKWFLLREPRPQKLSLSFFNRLFGAILGSIWSISILTLIVFGIDLLPLEKVFKYEIKEPVQVSHTYQILNRLIPIKEVKVIEKLNNMSKVSLDQEAIKKLSEQEEFKNLLEFEHLQAIIEDPETVSQLQINDLQKLLANPKILKLLNDGQFIEKLLKLDFGKALEEANKSPK